MCFLTKQKLILPGLLAVLLMAANPQAMAEMENRFITVTGKGEVSAAPDTVWVTSGVNTQADTAEQALGENNSLMQEMLDVFNDADIEESQIQTSGFSVQPVYDYSSGSKKPMLTGYQVTNSVTAKLTELDKLGDLLDDIVKAGSNKISGVRFGFADDEALLDQARTKAMENALNKARIYASAVDAEIGDVVSISETGTNVPAPVYRQARMAQATMAEGAPSVPVMKGEQDISATVTVVFELEI